MALERVKVNDFIIDGTFEILKSHRADPRSGIVLQSFTKTNNQQANEYLFTY